MFITATCLPGCLILALTLATAFLIYSIFVLGKRR